MLVQAGRKRDSDIKMMGVVLTTAMSKDLDVGRENYRSRTSTPVQLSAVRFGPSNASGSSQANGFIHSRASAPRDGHG